MLSSSSAAFVLVVATILHTVVCYMYLKPQKEGEGSCVDENWSSHPIGSSWSDDSKCEMMECVFYGDILYIRGYGCGAVGYPSECELVQGSGTAYPDCCPEVRCPEDSEYYDFY